MGLCFSYRYLIVAASLAMAVAVVLVADQGTVGALAEGFGWGAPVLAYPGT